MKAVFDPQAIEAELRKLEKEHSTAGTRTSLFNLVVFDRYAPDSAAASAQAAIDYLLGKRAARIVHITLDAPGSTEVYVRVRCAADRENRGVCFQEIRIASGEDGAGIAPGSWTAFLIRDIPVYVLWQCCFDAAASALVFAREQADKFFVDSGRCGIKESAAFLNHLRGIKTGLADQGVPAADFAWERFSPLRAFMAGAFDLPRAREALSGITEMSVGGAHEAQLILYALWTACSLGWTAAGNGASPDLDFTAPGGKKIHCTVESPGEPRAVIRFADGTDMRIGLSAQGIASAVFRGNECLTKALCLPSYGEILLRETDMPEVDGLYAKTLEILPG
jgi:hypothetical protein